MSLNTVTTGNTVLAADINQLVNVLQRAASQTEGGKHILNGWSNASGDTIGQYMQSISRGSTPSSVTIDTSDYSATNLNAPTTANLTANGFFIKATSTGATTSAFVGGNFTIQY